MMRRVAVLVASLSGVVLLHALRAGDLAAPPVGATDELGTWIRETDAVVAVFAVLRVVAMAAGAYLAAISALSIVGTHGRRPRLSRLVDAITLPALRPALASASLGTLVAVSGVTITAAGADPGVQPSDVLVEITADAHVGAEPTPAAPASTATRATTLADVPDPTEAPLPTMRALDPSRAPSVDDATPAPALPSIDTRVDPSAAEAEADTAAPVTMHRLDDLPPQPTATPSPTPTPVVSQPDAALVNDASWTIEPGQSFWSVAREHVADHRGHDPDDAEVDQYWRALMAANPDASPTGDPDLLYVGTVLVLPPL